MSRPPSSSPVAPVRGLGGFDATMLVVGTIIGGGIFVFGGEIASHVNSPAAFLGVWLAGGIIALCGAVSNGELGALFPRGGGEYVYLREAYGPALGFLSGWTSFWVVFPGSIATLAAAFGLAVGKLAGFDPGLADTVIATVAVVALTALNCFGLEPGKWTQNVLSVFKIAAFAVLLLVATFLGTGDTANFAPFFGEGENAAGLALAYLPVFFAYSGWNATTYLAGEVRDPGKNLGRSLVWGTAICVVLYLGANAIYLYALPMASIRGVPDVAQAATTHLFASSTATVIMALVPIVILGSLQATVVEGPRIFQAMAEDRLFFFRLARLSPRYRVPTPAIIVQGGLGCVLLWSGKFDDLLNFTTVSMLLFSALTVAAVYVLRRSRPDMPRPYRTVGYPVTPALFVASSVWVLYEVFAAGVVAALVGLAITLAGLPVYFWYRHRGGATAR